MKRIVFVFVLIAALAACFVSCDKTDENTDNGLDEYESMLESISNDTKPFAEKVYLTISENCSGELSLKAAELAQAIEEKTSVETLVKYDNQDIGAQEKDLRIFLGNTDHLVSQEAIKPLRYGDYLCKWDRGHIFLGGRHDDATVAAIDVFMARVLHGASYAFLMSEDAHFENINEYDLLSVTLNGYDLYDFTIVYGNKGDEKDIAEVIRKYISLRSGYFMDMIPENEVDDTVGKTLTLSYTDALGVGGVSARDLNVDIYGSDKYSLSVAAASFVDTLMGKTTQGGASAYISGNRIIPCHSGTLKMCSAYIGTKDTPSINYMLSAVSIIKDGGYDLIVFDRIGENYIQRICDNMSDIGYSVNRDAAGYLTVYKTGAFESVSAELVADGKALSVCAKAPGETETRRIIKAPSCDTVSSLVETSATYDIVLCDTEHVPTETLRNAGEKRWNFNGEDGYRGVVAEKYLKISGLTAAEDSGDGFYEMFLSFDSSVVFCEAFVKLKEAVE